MDTNSLKIVCYTGGTCGDLISALIDPTDSEFQNNRMLHSVDRQRLKKPHMFVNNEDKDQYIADISDCYLSIPSHDLDYHVLRGHKFISITVQDFSVAMWAAQRFKQLHRSHVWQEMQAKCGASTVEDYAQMLIDYSNMVAKHTNSVVQLEDILKGQAINCLENLGIDIPNKNLYLAWLDLQNTQNIS